MAKITVIIPNYNKERYVFECINSVRNQTHADFKCIVVDDGSTDGSFSVIQDAIGGDNRFMSYRNPNRGVAYSRNFGINRATTEFVMPVDADDYIDATYLERAMSFFDSHPDFTLYYGRWVFIGENAEQMNRRFGDLRYTGYKDLLISNSVHCSCAYRRADAVRCGLFDERLAGYEDWEFLIRLLHDNHTVGWDPRASLYYRQLPKSRTEADHQNYQQRVADIRSKNLKIYQEYGLA